MRTWTAWTRTHPFEVDVILTIVLVLPLVPFALGEGGSRIDAAYQMLIFLPLAWRRTAPVASFAAVAALLAGQLVITDVPYYADVALLLSLYAIAAHGPLWARRAGLGVGFLGALLSTLDWYRDSPESSAVATVVMMCLVVLAPWSFGAYLRTRREYVAGLEERARQLERDAAQQAQIAAAAERARIAREMHDVVAHSLSVIVVQADGALYASRTRPEVAAETLETISQTSRQSLAEMRRLLGLLREEVDDGDEATLRAPMPTAADVPTLIQQVRDSGLDVRLESHGDLGRVDTASGLTVYRVVQEALTNTLKHAGPGVRARVQLAVAGDHVLVRVEDDGGRSVPAGAPAAQRGGHGIRGIRERIAIHAGTVDAGPLTGGGFRVEAHVPMQQSPIQQSPAAPNPPAPSPAEPTPPAPSPAEPSPAEPRPVRQAPYDSEQL
ncbi:sensor histidine kinase [Mumia zhuanghuii]|uniref:histidine kinase n=2 Tax=Mumia TaxID=1546255 RepID=A0ABW1QQT4_9ACTN|nr:MULTISPECIES: histidine kinase [Mumia]KAA1422156.1 sensor histidine kinase [Mumia zhuanghuii]